MVEDPLRVAVEGLDVTGLGIGEAADGNAAVKLVKALPVQDDFARFLALAADSFIVRRGPNQRTVVAGYPGFGERSRDTMIALPGLCLATGRHEDAKKILRAFAKDLPKSLLPDQTSAAPERLRLLTMRAEALPDSGANIGIDLLQRFRLLFDYGRHTLYMVADPAALAQPIAAPMDAWPDFGGLEVTTSSTNLQALTDAVQA